MKDFVNMKGVYYHPYTAYQLLYPDQYDAKYAQQQTQDFQYYSERGYRGFGKDAKKKILQNNEESDHDSDRRKTYLLARHQYAEKYFVMLYPDRDEFLYCQQNIPYLQHNLSAQKLLQHRHFRMFHKRTNARHVVIPRIAHSARYPYPNDLNEKVISNMTTDQIYTIHKKHNVELDIHSYLTKCLENGYVKRDMSLLWNCFGKAKIENTKSKSGEILSQVCPFVGVHNTCLRCLCKKVKSKKCQYYHLNTVYFKPKKIYEKYGNAMYESPDEMINLWI